MDWNQLKNAQLKRLPTSLLDTSGPVPEAQMAYGLLADKAKQTVANMDKRNKAVAGLLDNPTLEGYQAAMDMVGMAPLGMTVWHGSPHKFSKFDMSKIGTGEGAQAYGHGLYTAELPEVAQQYQQFGSWQHRANGQAQPVMFKDSPVQFDKMGNVVGDHPKGLKMFLSRVASKGDYDAALNEVKQTLSDMKASGSFPSIQDDLAEEIAQATANKARIKASGAQGNLYKVDIPDEAVARFLDWDKPLSQQSNEAVVKARRYIDANIAQMKAEAESIIGKVKAEGRKPTAEEISRVNELQFKQSAARGDLDTAGGLYKRLSDDLGGQDAATKKLQELGIPGIRYLDGGSRSAGAGSSNFVLFDDQLPRILETNGVPTGLEPWKSGEWQGLLGNTEQKAAGLLDSAPMAQTEIYHSTSPASAKAIEQGGFDISKSADGTIWFTSNPNIGEVAASAKGAVVKRKIDESKLKLGGWPETDRYSTDELISQGYDGLKLVDGDGVTWQIFNPEKLTK